MVVEVMYRLVDTGLRSWLTWSPSDRTLCHVGMRGPRAHQWPSPAWWLGVALGSLAVVSQFALPTGTAVWDAAYYATAGVATAVLVMAAARMPRGARGIWWFLAGYVGLNLAGDVVYLVHEDVLGGEPFPGPADVLYLASYVSAIVALVRATRRMSSGTDRDALVDTSIITLALLAVATVFVFEPLLTSTEEFDLATAVGLAYPVLDIVLLAVLVRLLVRVRRLVLPLTLVTAAFVVVLVADLLYEATTVYGSSDPIVATYQALYLASLVLIALAATAPGAGRFAEPQEQPFLRPTSIRVFALTLGVITAPVLVLIVVWPDERLVERLLAIITILVILLALLRIRSLLITVESQADQLGRQARTDALTGLPNRRTLDYEVERTVQQVALAGVPLTVAMLDLDRFKSFNDQFGHQAGDALLRASARRWAEALPERAFLARYGGEEFALLLPGLTEADAAPLLEGLRAVTPPERTVSIGYAGWTEGETGFDALHRADRALYAAKAAGRDRVVRDDPDNVSGEAR
jgi:diguanylate cyclase (GGDEF)-like protein